MRETSNASWVPSVAHGFGGAPAPGDPRIEEALTRLARVEAALSDSQARERDMRAKLEECELRLARVDGPFRQI